jgi:hypothetical protein
MLCVETPVSSTISVWSVLGLESQMSLRDSYKIGTKIQNKTRRVGEQSSLPLPVSPHNTRGGLRLLGFPLRYCYFFTSRDPTDPADTVERLGGEENWVPGCKRDHKGARAASGDTTDPADPVERLGGEENCVSRCKRADTGARAAHTMRRVSSWPPVTPPNSPSSSSPFSCWGKAYRSVPPSLPGEVKSWGVIQQRGYCRC